MGLEWSASGVARMVQSQGTNCHHCRMPNTHRLSKVCKIFIHCWLFVIYYTTNGQDVSIKCVQRASDSRRKSTHTHTQTCGAKPPQTKTVENMSAEKWSHKILSGSWLAINRQLLSGVNLFISSICSILFIIFFLFLCFGVLARSLSGCVSCVRAAYHFNEALQ